MGAHLQSIVVDSYSMGKGAADVNAYTKFTHNLYLYFLAYFLVKEISGQPLTVLGWPQHINGCRGGGTLDAFF